MGDKAISSKQLLAYMLSGYSEKNAAIGRGYSRQPINQVITFPQISAIWASTSRPFRMSRTLRRFKLVSRSVIVESTIAPYGTRISSCATSNRPIEMMSRK